ncbi:EAL domain-containing protein [Sphingomonas sp.]|uniref:EAL domain-containing protein n=1 Tax=Sphingomonas sp. TaxID=28214 RepID=UPI0035C87210
MIAIDNLAMVDAAFGTAAARNLADIVWQRLEDEVGGEGIVTCSGESRCDIVLFGDHATAGRDAVWLARLLHIAGMPVACASPEPDVAGALDVAQDGRAAGGAVMVAPSLTGVVDHVVSRSDKDREVFDRVYEDLSARLDGARLIQSPPSHGEASASATAWEARYRDDMAAVTRLLAAMADERLCLAWQPIAGADEDRALFYHEALLRILRTDEERGAGAGGRREAPTCHSRFEDGIPLGAAAERIGLTRLIDRWVVVETIARLRVEPFMRLGCNISVDSAVLDGWWHDVIAQLAAAPDVAARLVIEVNEAHGAPRIGRAVAFAGRVRSLGCTIALDGFGAGRSAIGDMVALDPRIVKIDAACLRWAALDDVRPGAADELRHLIALCGARGRDVVIDGVDTPLLERAALAAGAPFLQGEEIGRARLSAPMQRVPIGRDTGVSRSVGGDREPIPGQMTIPGIGAVSSPVPPGSASARLATWSASAAPLAMVAISGLGLALWSWLT